MNKINLLVAIGLIGLVAACKESDPVKPDFTVYSTVLPTHYPNELYRDSIPGYEDNEQPVKVTQPTPVSPTPNPPLQKGELPQLQAEI